jgi:hypothetical protein
MKKFSVKSFIWVKGEGKFAEMAVRQVIELGKDLTWADAKKLRKENKNSWIV